MHIYVQAHYTYTLSIHYTPVSMDGSTVYQHTWSSREIPYRVHQIKFRKIINLKIPSYIQ